MKHALKAAFLAVVLLAATVFVLHAPRVEAKPEYAKKEKTGCLTCHVKVGKPDLNDIGKCYKEKKDLKACQEKK